MPAEFPPSQRPVNPVIGRRLPVPDPLPLAALEVSPLPLRLVQMQFSLTTKGIFPEMGKYLDPSGAPLVRV